MEETTEEKLKKLAEEKKALKEQILREKQEKKDARAGAKNERDGAIERTQVVLDAVQSEIFAYNRLGKARKMEANILRKIAGIIGGSVNANENTGIS